MTVTELPVDRLPVDRLDALEAKIDRLIDDAERRRRQRESFDSLVADATLLGPDVMAMVTERLAEAERKGYFAMLRELTKPETLALFGQMLEAVQSEQAAVEREPAEPPSLWALARQVHDPEVRRGIARALHTLRAVSVETGPHTTPQGVHQ